MKLKKHLRSQLHKYKERKIRSLGGWIRKNVPHATALTRKYRSHFTRRDEKVKTKYRLKHT